MKNKHTQVQFLSITLNRYEITLLFCYEGVLKCLDSVSVVISLEILDSWRSTVLCTFLEASAGLLWALKTLPFCISHPTGEVFQIYGAQSRWPLPPGSLFHELFRSCAPVTHGFRVPWSAVIKLQDTTVFPSGFTFDSSQAPTLLLLSLLYNQLQTSGMWNECGDVDKGEHSASIKPLKLIDSFSE